MTLTTSQYNRKGRPHGVDDLQTVAPAATNRPTLVRNGLNGRPYVDFGKSVRWVTDQGTEAFEGCFMNFNVAFGGVVSAFWVVGAQEGGGNLLGAEPFIRPGNSGYGWDWQHAIFETGGAINVLKIDEATRLFIDGRRVPVTSAFPAADWCTVGYFPPYMKPYDDAYAPDDETKTKTISLCGRLFADGKRGAKGGQRLAEVILYDRVLNERERVATRNYLMKKWFNREPQPLPAEEGTMPYVRTVELADGAAFKATRAVEIERLEGTGRVTVEGLLRVTDPSGVAGTLHVAGGTLSLFPAVGAAGEAELVTDGLVWQADAAWGVETNGAGKVTCWKNRADGGATALTPLSSASGVTFDPQGFHRRPKVDLVRDGLTFTSASGAARMHLTSIRTVFWVMPSH